MRIDEGVIARFWKYSGKCAPDECWIWAGGGVKSRIPGKPYGNLKAFGKMERAHRLSWRIHCGVDPGPWDVLHDCPGGDNPSCVNPAHLWLGNDQANSRDMVEKGRSIRGEQQWCSVLNWPKAREIRRLYATGECSQEQLGRMFDVSQFNISLIIRNKIWVEDPVQLATGSKS